MKMRFSTAVFLLSGLLLAACSTQDVAGKGVASETTNGGVAGVLKDSLGDLLSGRVVELRSVRDSRALVAARDTTDSLGRFLLEASDGDSLRGRFLVWMTSGDAGVSRWVTAGSAETDLGTLSVGPLDTLRGEVSAESGGAGSIALKIAGTDDFHSLNADSTFVIPGMPRGAYLLRMYRDSVLVGDALVADSSENALWIPATPEVLVDDFEGPETVSALETLFGDSPWLLWNDTGATVEENGVWSSVEGLRTDSAAWEGYSLRVPLFVGPAFEEDSTLVRSAGVQLMLGGDASLDSGSAWHPFSAVDSIVFYAKGSGTFSFMLRVQEDGAGTYLYTSISLDSTWRRYVFSPEDFTGPPGFSLEECEVMLMMWKTYEDSSEIWLDDIRLLGATYSDLLSD